MDKLAFTESASGRLMPVEKGVHAFVPNKLPPELTIDWPLAKAISDADRALSELSGVGATLPNPHLLIRPFMAREALLSSRIEGTQASLSDYFVYEGLAEEDDEPDDQNDAIEVFNYVRALEHGLSSLSQMPLCLRLTRDMHAILMRGARGQDKAPGEFRRIQNWIGPHRSPINHATYVPPPVPELEPALSALEAFWNEPNDLPPLVSVALAHYQFEAIHPFIDGNGRLGRLLITLMLCAYGLMTQPLLYLSAYFEGSRRGYYERLLAVSTEGAWRDWIIYFLEGVQQQAKDALKRSRLILSLWQQHRDILQTSARASGLQLALLDLFFFSPIVSVKNVSKKLGITPRAAQLNIDKLVEHGIIREMTGRKRNRLFVADRILRITDDPYLADE